MWKILLAIPVISFFLYRYIVAKRKQRSKSDGVTTIAFFHVFCNDGGGAERVLWSAIHALYALPNNNNIRCVIYSGETISGAEILRNAEKQFGIKIQKEVDFVFVQSREMLQCLRYHRWSLWQLMFGAFIVALEGLLKFQPDVMIDTTGHASAVFVFKYFGRCKVVSYLHWPTITADEVESIRKGLLPSGEMTPLGLIGTFAMQMMLNMQLKLYLPLYSWLGRHADIIMVNSSWTARHFAALWGVYFSQLPENQDKIEKHSGAQKGLIVYPPCNSAHRSLSLENKQRKFVAVAQFRPEKDHPLKLKALHVLFQRYPYLKNEVKLALVGSSRHEEDWVRVEKLKHMTKELGLENNVEFHVNSSFENLQAQLQSSIAGLHTMWNEHFGICVVELLGGGVIPIAHNTGGPRDDIVRPIDGKPTGYLAITPEEYADCMATVLHLPKDELKAMQLRARKQFEKFSDEEFATQFIDAVSPAIEAA